MVFLPATINAAKASFVIRPKLVALYTIRGLYPIASNAGEKRVPVAAPNLSAIRDCCHQRRLTFASAVSAVLAERLW